MALSILAIRQAGAITTDKDPATELGVPGLAHHRQLVAMDKYAVSGYGASIDAYWCDGSCGYGSYFYFSASDGVYKYQSSGKPSKTPSEYAWGYLDLWSNCSDTEATYTYASFDIYETMDFVVGKKLNKATLDADAEVFVITETCTPICDPDWGCYYGDCTTVDFGYVPATLTASWTATDSVSTSTWMSKSSGPGYAWRSTFKGKFRPAAATLSFALNGSPLEIPLDDAYAQIQQVTSGDVYKYKN